MTVYRYTFEDTDGHEFGSYTTQDRMAAHAYGYENRLRVIANEYTWADSELEADYTHRPEVKGDRDMTDANHATWAFNLHWQNDYELYHAILAWAKTQKVQNTQTKGRNLKDLMHRVCTGNAIDSDRVWFVNVDPKVLDMMGREVGDFNAVSEDDVGEALDDALGGVDYHPGQDDEEQ